VTAALAGRDASDGRSARPAVFCDRDGVLNVRRLDHVKSTDEFDFLPGALAALAELRQMDVPVVVISNQSVIGRGLVSMDDVANIHTRMRDAVVASGGPRLAVYVCPHAPQDSCDCRKPRPGLLYRAAADLGLDLQRSVFIGDSVVDVCAALAAGCHPILVGSPKAAIGAWPDGMVGAAPSLAEAVVAIRARPEFSPLAARDAVLSRVNGVHS
jgi:D-glycero-D-manno-heptose 1,7-bisphosphate phosphatase